MKSIEARLARLESKKIDAFSDVQAWIASGRLYNELSEAERVRYAEYLGVDCEAMEAVEQAVNGTLCFQLENRKPKSTAADLKRIAAEIEKEMLM